MIKIYSTLINRKIENSSGYIIILPEYQTIKHVNEKFVFDNHNGTRPTIQREHGSKSFSVCPIDLK